MVKGLANKMLVCTYVHGNGVIGNTRLIYADDSAILLADKDISAVGNSLQTDLQIVNELLVDDTLSLHSGKTESLLFSSKSRFRQQ